jgi:UDP-N-acetylmuramate: L-alanyl-gamma-D-glutamyl-meso-diaminopimelate ligase
MHGRIIPELAKARELGIKIYSYPEYIFEQSENKQSAL